MRTRLVGALLALWVSLCLPAEAGLISYGTTWTDGQVLTHSALNNNFTNVSDVVNGSIDAANLAATITFADSDFIDLSAINMSSATEGLKLGQATSCASATAEGQVCWDTDNNFLSIGDGTTAVGLTGDLSARVFNSASISILNNTSTVLTFDSERWDTDTIHSTASNTGRLTATTAGKYFISAHVVFTNNATGERLVNIRVNGATVIAGSTTNSNGTGLDEQLSVATHYDLAAADYVECVVLQDSGGALNAQANTNYSPEFGMVKVP